jgi:hypothetical protein
VHLASDVTLLGATPVPDQPPVPDGTLAFVLPNIPPFGEIVGTGIIGAFFSIPAAIDPLLNTPVSSVRRYGEE